MTYEEFTRIKANNEGSVQPDRTIKKLCDSIDSLRSLLKRFTDLDCCTGFALRETDYPAFWDALDAARDRFEKC